MRPSPSDPRLPHRLHEWARASGSAPSERHADAIVEWLRSHRASEYSRKPASGLRRQVLGAIERLRAAPSSSPGGKGGEADGEAEERLWAVDPLPSAAPHLSGLKRALGEARGEAGKAARLDARGGEEGYNLLNASLRAQYDGEAARREAEAAAAGGEAAAAGGAEAAAGGGEAAAEAEKRRGRRRERRGARLAAEAGGAVGYADVGGLEAVLQEVRELVEYPLTHPELYAHLGVAPPRGLLLHGPPGCGKTLLAHAIAGELGVAFLRVSAPEVVSGMSGESEAKVRALFKDARDQAPAIVFIDEIDAIAPKRENAQREMERRIVAQLLTCMDELSFQATGGQAVIVMAATNRPDAIDPALRRAGRFDRELALGIPDAAARARILTVLCKSMRLDGGLDLDALARRCNGFVGADLSALCKEAAVAAVNRIFGSLLPSVEASPLVTRGPSDLNLEPAAVPSSSSDHEAPHDATPAEPQAAAALDSLSARAPLPKGGSLAVGQAASSALRRQSGPLPPEVLATLSIEMQDFEVGLRKVQPSAKREGFATIPDVSWEDVGAMSELRAEMNMAIVQPILTPERFDALGISPSAGVLLYGPPGCGKTLLAKAIANESGASFIAVKGPELINKFVGESERAVRQLFARGRASAPCVIFFDELDALVPRRGSESGSQATERVVNQMLTEMDGLEGRKSVFVIAATNRPDMLDPAMLRPGRLDKLLYVPLPTPQERTEILRTAVRRMPLSASVDLAAIATDRRCNGFSGADLASLAREAATAALRSSIIASPSLPNATLTAAAPSITPQVGVEDFERAFELVLPSVSPADEARYRSLSMRLRTSRAAAASAPRRPDGEAGDAGDAALS